MDCGNHPAILSVDFHDESPADSWLGQPREVVSSLDSLSVVMSCGWYQLSLLPGCCVAPYSQLYVLLEKWPKLSPEVSMELLDYQYADITLRGYAVNCMEVLR